MIEDSATDAELALRMFKHARIVNPLTVVTSGEDAMAYLLGTGAFAKSGPGIPLLILLDLQLSGMPGLELLSQLKADQRTWDIPVVSLSLTRNAQAITMCLQRGVVEHIIKPVDLAALVRVTRKLNLKLTRTPAGAAPTATTSRSGAS